MKKTTDRISLLKVDCQRFLVRFFASTLFFCLSTKLSPSIRGIIECFLWGFLATGIIEIGDILSAITIEHFRLSRVFNNGTSTLYWITFLSLYYFTLFSNLSIENALFCIILSILYAIAGLIYWYFRDI